MADQSLGGLLSSRFQSPLFQMGLGTYSGASNGGDWAKGMMGGQKLSQETQSNALEQQQKQMAYDQAQQRQNWMKNINPNDPVFKGLPQGLLSMAQGTGDPSILANAYKSKMDLDQQERIARMQGNIALANHLAQKKGDMDLQLQQQQSQWDMVNKLLSSGQSGQPQVRRWNPDTQRLE